MLASFFAHTSVVGVIRSVLGCRFTPEEERRLIVQGHLHWVRAGACVRVPVEIALSCQRFEHESAYYLPVGAEFYEIHAELSHRPLIVGECAWPIEAVVEARN